MMDESRVTSTLAALIQRVETLEAENGKLRAQNAECGTTVARLVKRLEDLQAVKAELEVKVNDGLATKAAEPAQTPYRKRPPVMRGRTVQSNVGCGPLYITLNEDDNGTPFEVFFKLGKSGSCQQSYLEALGVAISVGLRYGADPQKFIDKFEGMRCPNPKIRDAHGPSTLSCADGISQGLAKALTLALPLEIPPEARAEAAVVAVAEPQFPYPPEEVREHEANLKSIDLISGSYSEPSNGEAHTNGNGNGNGGGLSMKNLRRAMQTGVGLCPKCSGPLISQGGCVQCLQQCGYVGKCS
jgi:hypothetical protein